MTTVGALIALECSLECAESDVIRILKLHGFAIIGRLETQTQGRPAVLLSAYFPRLALGKHLDAPFRYSILLEAKGELVHVRFLRSSRIQRSGDAPDEPRPGRFQLSVELRIRKIIEELSISSAA